MAKIVGLPKLSPTMEEGTLARWAKAEGDTLDIDDLVAEVETDKATMEWRSFDRGVLLKILVPEGTTLAPDQPVAIIGEAGEDVSALVAEASSGAPAPSAPAQAAQVAPAAEPEAASAPAAPSAAATPSAPAASSPRPSGGRVLASPFVRKLARERDLDLSSVSGSGPGGRIIKRDLDGLTASPEAQRTAPTSSGGSFERREPVVEKLSQMRKTIARRLTESKQSVPHFYLTIDVDAEPLLAARAAMMAELGESGEKVSVNDLLIKACAMALRRVPNVNSSYAGDTVLRHQVVDISVAVAIPDGLVTPVVRDADRKSVLEIARDVRDLAKRAKDKKLKLEEMTNGTFSISNLGMFGIEDFSAVINPPEGAILAVGTVREEPVVKKGAVVVGKRLRMTLSCDHRVVDGAVGAEWLAALRRILESPITMLL